MHNYNKQVDESLMNRARQLTTTRLTFLDVLLQPTMDPDRIAVVREEDEDKEGILRLMTNADWQELSRILKICIEEVPES